MPGARKNAAHAHTPSSKMYTTSGQMAPVAARDRKRDKDNIRSFRPSLGTHINTYKTLPHRPSQKARSESRRCEPPGQKKSIRILYLTWRQPWISAPLMNPYQKGDRFQALGWRLRDVPNRAKTGLGAYPIHPGTGILGNEE